MIVQSDGHLARGRRGRDGELDRERLWLAGRLQENGRGLAHPAPLPAFELIDATGDLLLGLGRVHGQIGESGLAFDHQFGSQLIDRGMGDIEWAQAEKRSGISGAALERDDPQRDG